MWCVYVRVLRVCEGVCEDVCEGVCVRCVCMKRGRKLDAGKLESCNCSFMSNTLRK